MTSGVGRRPGLTSKILVPPHSHTGEDIVDGSIVNADIGAAAAIAQSKIANLTSDLAGKASITHTHSASDITTGTVAAARLGSGTADATTFLRGDGTWAVSGEVPRVSGCYYLWGQSGGNFSPVKDRLYLVPFPTFGSVTLAALAMHLLVAGGAGSVFRMGLYAYNEALGVPWGAPLVDAGTVTANATTGVKELPFSVSTSARMVVLASVWQGGTVGSGTVSGVNATSQSYAMPYVSSPTPLVGAYNFPALGWIIPSVTGALPTISAAPATSGDFFPRLIVKVG